ncbi:malto-oligosyltrehalose synthase [Marmoricola sp. URHB0036]|uniref:malto-oligosyltrehalose synthase n=1 Tax=Marmoricola sp. URHB0036 TaxID=1298863 RepID=UPI000403DB83|nr:malto-oligosyltrehalose synthase [Marmoricola sp. URHB0036]
MTAGPQPRRPASTYRLQITADFDLFEAAQRLPYLHELGVDWVYLSPLLAAEPGSTHGYDVVSFDHVDASRGGADGLAAVSAEARRLGMGVLVDIVPNHVGVATPATNPWWWDVLEHGPGSRRAEAFDIDWEFGNGRVRLPVLGDDDLPRDGHPTGHLAVVDDELRYRDHRFPIAPGTDHGSADEVHARQHYELVGWRRGDSDLNYRRFFTVTTLAGVRVEVPEIFAATHAEVRRWFDEGLVDGLRIDHPDGLRDPEGYLDHLADLTSGGYTLVEKILEPGEDLPRGWAMDGTTGYDVLALLDRVLTDPAGEEPLTDLDRRLRGQDQDWHALVHDRKRAVADGSLLAETRRIVRELPDLLPHSHEQLEDAVAELLACFPVYRSYLPDGREHLEHALAAARTARPDLDAVVDDLGWVLADPEAPAALRFQQTSGMVMAKGVEDNAFYRTSRLTSLTEVGGDPDIFAISPDEFHDAMAARQRDWPHAMTALSTHDTKRSEDVRARITALAEVPGEWESAVTELQRLAPMPDAGLANLLWQAAVGAWPISRERIHAYAEKAMREGGEHTTWTDADADFEARVHAALDAAYDDSAVAAVLEGIVARIEPAGRSNAMAAKLLSLTLPGVPDVYQGTELGDFSLVDPDNRRPVDFDAAWASLADGWNPKQALTAEALRLRRDRPELFTSYAAVAADGAAADHVLAFDRGGAITVVTRLPLGLEARGGWGETVLLLPDGTRRVTDVLGNGAVALLVKED